MKARFRLLIYPRFQLLLVFINFTVLSVIYGLLYFQYNRVQGRIRTLGLEANLPPNHGFFQIVDVQSKEYLTGLSVAMIAGIFISTIVILVLSNKLAGPIVRLRGFFGEIASGGLPAVKKLSFRKGDFFSELPSLINQAFEKIQK